MRSTANIAIVAMVSEREQTEVRAASSKYLFFILIGAFRVAGNLLKARGTPQDVAEDRSADARV